MRGKVEELFEDGPAAVNMGVQDFAESLRAQGAEAVQVDWAPPAGGDPELTELLDQLL